MSGPVPCPRCGAPMEEILLDNLPARVCPICGMVRERPATWAEFLEAL